MAKILIIDDEELLRNLVRARLERDGHVVIEAADGKAGERLFRDEIPDLVICDILMPERDGLEVMMSIRGDFPKTKFIAISGGGDFRDLSHLRTARYLGAIRTLAKPFSVTDLSEIVSETLTNEP